MFPPTFQQMPFNFNMIPQPPQVPQFPQFPAGLQANNVNNEQSGHPEVNGVPPAPGGSQGQPAAPAGQHVEPMRFTWPAGVVPNHEQLHQNIHQQQHEQWLASLRNHNGQNGNITTSNATPANASSATAQPATANAAEVANAQQQEPSAEQPQHLTSSSSTLPSWGSDAAEHVTSRQSSNRANGESSGRPINGHQEHTTESTPDSSSSSQAKQGLPTVEDLVEDPD